jgi:hypothetical protein
MKVKALDPYEILNPLFDKAKESDEFEFCCSLLRIRGIETYGWDPLHETDQLTKQILSLINSPIVSDLKYRLSLFLYCHLTEMSDVYNIVGNMLRVISGERYSINPFIAALHHSKRDAKYPTSKAERIKEWSNEVNLTDVGELFETFLVKQVRNAFYHSDYILTNESFNIKHGEPVLIGNVMQHKVPLDWLTPKVELGINTALSVINITMDHIRSYQADKIVKGRFAADGSYEDIQLTVREGYGLVGFKSPPDESLRAKKAD